MQKNMQHGKAGMGLGMRLTLTFFKPVRPLKINFYELPTFNPLGYVNSILKIDLLIIF